MNHLRCWPGAVCRIVVGPLRDHFVTVRRLLDLPLPGAWWEVDDSPVSIPDQFTSLAFHDTALQPIVPRPGTMTDILSIPIYDQSR